MQLVKKKKSNIKNYKSFILHTKSKLIKKPQTTEGALPKPKTAEEKKAEFRAKVKTEFEKLVKGGMDKNKAATEAMKIAKASMS